MRKLKKTIRKVLVISIIFLIIFILSFLAFGYLINKFTPSVDVQIGGSSVENTNENSTIDERLKQIQNDDNGGSDLEQSNVEEEPLPLEDKEDVTTSDNDINQSAQDNKPIAQKAPVPKPSDITKQIPNPSQTSVKIFVGYYVTLEQAAAAQENIKEQLPSLTPFIKEVNEYYIVQIGAFSNRDTAVELYNTLKNMNYPVKMKSE